VIAGMNTGRGHDLLGVCEVRTVTLPGCFGVPAAGRSGSRTGFRDSPAGLDRMADRNRALCESRRRPGLARLPAVAETGRLEFAPFS
jgi:hypothetical protein